MVLDFGKVKKELKYLIDEYVDHKLLVPAEHEYTRITHHTRTDQYQVDFNRPDGLSIHLLCPAEAYAFVYSDAVTIPSVGQYLKDVIATHLPENVEGIELILRPEVITTPFYHYTHGLKKHDGNCQRIAHGHRSKVLVHENGEQSAKWQEYWANRWADIYIGTRSDLVFEQNQSFFIDSAQLPNHYLFSYESSQGEFSLAIPQSESEIIESDSTVECLAQYMLEEQKRLEQDSNAVQFKIFAFEGVGKGAIAGD